MSGLISRPVISQWCLLIIVYFCTTSVQTLKFYIYQMYLIPQRNQNNLIWNWKGLTSCQFKEQLLFYSMNVGFLYVALSQPFYLSPRLPGTTLRNTCNRGETQKYMSNKITYGWTAPSFTHSKILQHGHSPQGVMGKGRKYTNNHHEWQ